MIAALNSRTASGRYTSLCIRRPRRNVTIASRANRAVAIQPPEIGPREGGVDCEYPPDLTVVVNVNVVVTTALPGVSVVCENDPVVSGGRLEAENVTAFGKPPVPGVSWIVAVIGVPAVAAAGGVGTAKAKEMPVPDKEMVCVVGDASSVTVNVAGPRAPAAPGVKVTLMTQLAAGATVDPFVQVVPVVATAKSAAFVPLIATELMCSVEPPGLVNVMEEALLAVPTP